MAKSPERGKENSPISGDTTTPAASEPEAKGANALKLFY
jgi:hypothetical protein